MISYHPESNRAPVGTDFTAGFEIAATSDLQRIAKGICQFAWSGNAWKGGYRRKENFLFSDYCVLDIDDEQHDFPLKQALKVFCDMQHIIGTTRNHQRDKKGKGICDRYRVVIPWQRRIDELELYEGNMLALLTQFDSLDASTLSGAQHFFPCATIVSVSTEGEKQEVKNKRVAKDKVTDVGYSHALESKRLNYDIIGKLPVWVEDFLKTGNAARRHYQALGVAQEMLELGISTEEVINRISLAPISRKYRYREVDDIVRWAQKRIDGRLRNGERKENRESDYLPGYREIDRRGSPESQEEISGLRE